MSEFRDRREYCIDEEIWSEELVELMFMVENPNLLKGRRKTAVTENDNLYLNLIFALYWEFENHTPSSQLFVNFSKTLNLPVQTTHILRI